MLDHDPEPKTIQACSKTFKIFLTKVRFDVGRSQYINDVYKIIDSGSRCDK